MIDTQEFLTTTEAAKIMRLSTKRVSQLCQSGEIKAKRTGKTSGHWRIFREQFMQSMSIQPDDNIPAKPETELVDWGVFDRAKELLKRAK